MCMATLATSCSAVVKLGFSPGGFQQGASGLDPPHTHTFTSHCLNLRLAHCPAFAQVLLNNGADPKLVDKGSKTPLSWCLALDKASTLGCAAMLLYMGAKPEDCKDTTGEGLLHRAVRYGASTFIGVWSRYGGNMLLTSTTDPDADDVPGAEEAAAVSVDAMDEEWDPFEVSRRYHDHDTCRRLFLVRIIPALSCVGVYPSNRPSAGTL